MGAVMLALIALCGGIGYMSATNTQHAIAELGSATIVVQRHMNSDMMHDAIRADVAAAIAALDPSTGISMRDSLTAIDEDSATFLRSVGEAKANAHNPAVLSALNALNVPLGAYIASAREMQRRLKKDPVHAAAAFPAFERHFERLRDAMEKASETIENAAKQANASEVTKASSVRTLMIAALMASVALAIVLGMVVSRFLVRPLAALGKVTHDLATGNYDSDVPHRGRADELGTVARGLVELRDAGRQKRVLENEGAAAREAQSVIVHALSEGLKRLREGDFTKPIAGTFAPEYAILQENFNHASGELRDMMQIVNSITDEVRRGAQDIAESSDDLARRTEGNAASLEQTSAALIEIDGRLKTSAASSHATVERANEAIATVDGGRSTAESAVAAMSRVRDSAKGIDDVIEGLDKIAFQTRVLAMNAAVEAGRAGEAGRGFAVVADLVSALAMRAEEEAQRARDQLTATQVEVAGAVVAVEKVDGALAKIAEDVGTVHTLLETMADDNQAQALAVTEITAAIASMDNATQQNAANVEVTALSARKLTASIDRLVDRAKVFNYERRVRSVPVAHERRSAEGRMDLLDRPEPPAPTMQQRTLVAAE